MSEKQGKSCPGTNLGDTRVDPSTLVCHTKGCIRMGAAYYYNNQRTKRKTWENWAFCSVCMNTLRKKSRMSSRKSHQKKKDQEAMNKAKTLIALKSAQHQSQMIVEKTTEDQPGEESQSAKSVDSDDVTSDIETKVIEDETTLVVEKAKEANVLIVYIDLNLRKNRYLPGDKFGMGVFSKAYSYQILAATQRLTQKLNQNNTSFIGSPKKLTQRALKSAGMSVGLQVLMVISKLSSKRPWV